MKKKRRKYFIKKPLTLLAIISSLLTFVPPITAAVLQRVNKLPDWLNTLSIVSILLAFVPILILCTNFELFMEQQGLSNVDKVKKYDKLNKPFVLVKQNTNATKSLLIVSISLLGLLWILYDKIGLIICIAITVVLVVVAVLSFIFSFIKVKKILIYHNKKLIVEKDDLTLEFPIEELRFCRKEYDETNCYGRYYFLAKYTKYDIILYLKNKTLTLHHVDAILAIETTINTIREINGLPSSPEIF